MGVFIPLLAIFFGGLMMISRTPMGHALARRIGGEVSSADADERIAQLEHDMEAVRNQLEETQERVDFAERMLAQVREAQRLPPSPT
jgi:hypothetical protein